MNFLETYTYHNRNITLTYIKGGNIITNEGVFLHFYFHIYNKSFPALFIPKKWKNYFSKLYNSLTEIHKEHYDVWYAIHNNKEAMEKFIAFYFDEVKERVKKLFSCSHPLFDSVITK